MDLHHKHGISKRKFSEKRQKLKKTLRYFSMEEPGTEDTGPLSGTQLCSVKKRKMKTFQGDMTKKLLEMVSLNARLSDMCSLSDTRNTQKIQNVLTHRESSGGHMHNELVQEKCGEVSRDIASTSDNDKTNNDSVKPSPKSCIPSEVGISLKKRKVRNTEDICQKVANDCRKPKSHVQQNICCEDDRKKLHSSDMASTHQTMDQSSLNVLKGNSQKTKKGIKKSSVLPKTGNSKIKSTCVEEQLRTEGQDNMNEKNNETNSKLKSPDRLSPSTVPVKAQPSSNCFTTLSKEGVSLVAQNFLPDGKSKNEVVFEGSKNKIGKNKMLKQIKSSSSQASSELLQRKKTRKNSSSSKNKSIPPEQSGTCREDNVTFLNGTGGACLSSVNNEQPSVINNSKKSEMNVKHNTYHNKNQPDFDCVTLKEDKITDRKRNCFVNEKEVSTDLSQDFLSIVDNSDGTVQKKKQKLKLKTLQKNLADTSPILIEMCKTNSTPSYPLNVHEATTKKQITKSALKIKSGLSLRPCVASTQKWEVQYGNAEYSSILDKDNIEMVNTQKEMRDDEFMVSYQKWNETSMPLTASEPSFTNVENQISDYESLPVQSSDDCATQAVVEHDLVVKNQLFSVSETEMILALPSSFSLYFKGALKVKVLVGKIDILGCELSHTNTESYTVYSPHQTSFLCFQACSGNNCFSSETAYWKRVQKNLIALENTECLIKRRKKELQKKIIYKIPVFTSLVLLECVSDTLIPFLHKYFQSTHFPTITSRKIAGSAVSAILKAEFVSSPSMERLYEEKFEWLSLVDTVFKRQPGNLRVMTCGGKGVGKSTFLRFLTNKALCRNKEVLYIDLDPGQCEFTPPGSISAVVVKKPVLGPNFTHLTVPDRMVYIGDVDTSRCAVHYLQCCQYIIDWCFSQANLAQLPWFINTMGFSKGLGVELTTSVIKIISPSDVIEIRSCQSNRNFPFFLNAEVVENFVPSLHKPVSGQEGNLNYSFHTIQSAAEERDGAQSPWGMQSNLARDTALLSYFHQMVVPPAFSLLEVAPHILPFAGLKLCVSHEKLRFSDYLSAMNANLVALCDATNSNGLIPNDPAYPQILEKAPVCQCFGYGIVRCVDLEKKIIFISSPVEQTTFKFVNCLVLGALHLPDIVYTLQDEALGSIPYVTHGERVPLAKGVRTAKSIMKLN